MASIPATMRAAVTRTAGPARKALDLRTDWPSPSPTPTGSDLLVRVSHVTLNPADAFYISIIPAWLPFRRHAIPGIDFAGEVVAAGPQAPSTFSPGTEVCGGVSVSMVVYGRGSLTEFILVPAAQVALKPKGLSAAKAAGLGVAGQTAVVVIRAAGGIKAGDRILVNGASGGVGTMLTQIAKGRGAYVVGICSGGNAEFVKQYGVDEVVDYKLHNPVHAYASKTFEDSPFDTIFDCVGDFALYRKCASYLKREGHFVSINGGWSSGVVPTLAASLPVFLGGTPRKFTILLCKPSGEQQREAVQLVEDGILKDVPIDSEFTFEQTIEAFERVETHRSKGKVVVTFAK